MKYIPYTLSIIWNKIWQPWFFWFVFLSRKKWTVDIQKNYPSHLHFRRQVQSFIIENDHPRDFVSIVANKWQQYHQNRLMFNSLNQWLKPLATKISPLPEFRVSNKLLSGSKMNEYVVILSELLQINGNNTAKINGRLGFLFPWVDTTRLLLLKPYRLL